MFALVMTLGLGCGDPAAKLEASKFVGTWQDNGGGGTVIELKRRAPVAVSMTDYDGEAFEMRESRFEAGSLSFDYFVPSTSYEVTITTTRVEGDLMCVDWANQYDKGEECWTRID